MIPGEIYHLYNHANGWEDLFKDDEDFEIFISKIIQNTSSIARYYAYCLMPNHFHFLLELRTEREILKTMIGNSIEKKISRSFSNVFSGYTKKVNHKYSRMGSLFMPNMSSRIIESENDFCKVAHYIHANPVHHGFTDKLDSWKHSSYSKILRQDETWLDVDTVLDYFGNLDSFISYHSQPIDLKIKEKYGLH